MLPPKKQYIQGLSQQQQQQTQPSSANVVIGRLQFSVPILRVVRAPTTQNGLQMSSPAQILPQQQNLELTVNAPQTSAPVTPTPIDSASEAVASSHISMTTHNTTFNSHTENTALPIQIQQHILTNAKRSYSCVEHEYAHMRALVNASKKKRCETPAFDCAENSVPCSVIEEVRRTGTDGASERAESGADITTTKPGAITSSSSSSGPNISVKKYCFRGPPLDLKNNLYMAEMPIVDLDPERIRMNVLFWSITDTCAYVEDTLGSSEAGTSFFKAGIDGAQLSRLQTSDLSERFGLKMGQVIRMYSHILQLLKLAQKDLNEFIPSNYEPTPVKVYEYTVFAQDK